jgi:hypothetical protein
VHIGEITYGGIKKNEKEGTEKEAEGVIVF